MKKITSIIVLMMMFVNLLGLSGVYAARKSRISDIGVSLYDAPHTISDLTKVNISEINPPKFQVINDNWRYGILKSSDYKMTIIERMNGDIYFVLGHFYYDFYSDLFIPMDDNIALRLGIQNYDLVVYGDKLNDSNDFYAVVMPQIVEGNAGAYLYLVQKPFVGGGGFYEFNVIVPEPYSSTMQIDIGYIYTFDFSHASCLPGQNGQVFNWENLLCKVEYYTYTSNKSLKDSDGDTLFYTHIELVDLGKDLWISGVLLYDPGYQAFYTYNCNGSIVKTSIKFKYLPETESFYITCGKILGISQDYKDENGIYSLGINRISFAPVSSCINDGVFLDKIDNSPLAIVSPILKNNIKIK